MEITATEQNKQKRMEKKNEDSLRDLWNNIKCTNICIIGILQGEEAEKRPEKISEERPAENFPNVGKQTLNQVQEAERSRQDKPQEEHRETHSNQKWRQLETKIKY